MTSLIFATHNAHKLVEVQQILSLSDKLVIENLDSIGFHDEIEETADTLSGNASIKSRTVYDSHGGNVFSEDTGLEVMALGMAPGVHTARYAGESRDANANMDKLLAALQDLPERTARFRTVISLIWVGEEHSFEGIVNGRIALEKAGTTGFGYDPIFIPYGYDKTFAELSSVVKNGISHRYRAMCSMQKFLKNRVG